MQRIREKARSGNILFISDLHAPYQHPDALQFLKALHEKYEFARIICLGDELDYHAMSFHEHNPDLDSAGRELQRGREVLWELWRMFPVMDLVDSNHGSMAYRKGVYHGIPRHLILEYRDAIFGEKDKRGNISRPGNRGVGWNWQASMNIEVPGGLRCKVVHGMGVSTRRNVEQSGMCFVQGHHHGVFELVFHGSPDSLTWGMTCGCLIWDREIAFAYNKYTLKRPVIGCGAVINGNPRLLPMKLEKGGRWTGVVP